MSVLLKKSIDEADEVIDVPKGRVETVKVGEVTFSRSVFEPGWKWSESVKPIAQTDSCVFPHAFYVASGSMHIQMDDGQSLDAGPGDVVVIGPGHDAWVTSDDDESGHGFAEMEEALWNPSFAAAGEAHTEPYPACECGRGQ